MAVGWAGEEAEAAAEEAGEVAEEAGEAAEGARAFGRRGSRLS